MSKPTIKYYNAKTKVEGSFNGYLTGFLLSIIFTITAYILTIKHSLDKNILIFLLISLALIQFAVQVVFFLHIGKESKPRYRLLAFAFMIIIVLILVLGSLWIMSNLSNNMTIGQQIKYMDNQGGGF